MTYESDVLRDWYLLFHYGSPEEILHGSAVELEGLPKRCLDFPVTTVEAAGSNLSIGRALDLGCAVGRSAFEISRLADEVIGIDFSANFIDVAEVIRTGGRPVYRRYGEMHLAERLEARCPEGTRPSRISFEVGDAMSLRKDLGTFDLVHAANLLCRLTAPERLLARLPELVNPGGRLVLATPATWMEAHTPPENQPTGLTLDYLRRHLEGKFELLTVSELPFLIREHQRKFQLSTSQTSVWAKR